MATIDSSISDLAWLNRGPDQNALARGVASGAQIAQIRNQKASLAQRRYEFEQQQQLAQQQESRLAGMAALDMTLKDQAARMQAVQLKDTLEQREAMIQDREALGQVQTNLAEALRARNVSEAYNIMNYALSSNMRFIRNPEFIALQKNLDDYVKTTGQLELDKARAANYLSNAETVSAQPEIQLVDNPLTGKPVAYGRTGPNSFERIPERATAQASQNKLAVRQLQMKADALTREWAKLDPNVKGNRAKSAELSYRIGEIQRSIMSFLESDSKPQEEAVVDNAPKADQPKRLQWTPEGLVPMP